MASTKLLSTKEREFKDAVMALLEEFGFDTSGTRKVLIRIGVGEGSTVTMQRFPCKVASQKELAEPIEG